MNAIGRTSLAVAMAALALLAVRIHGPALTGFDGSIAVRHVNNVVLTGDLGERIVVGRSPNGTIVVLGYTRCTDACPLTVAHVAAALAGVAVIRRPVALFVTVDPEHDDPTALRGYLAAWNNRLIGVTGERTELYRLYAALGATGGGSRYRDHDTRIFLLNPDGDVEQELSPEASSAEIAGAIRPQR